MTDYETYCKIKQMRNQQLRISQIAQPLGIDEKTAKYWADQKTYHQRKTTRRAGKLDPYKPRILELVEKHPYTSVQINRFLQQEGYQGGLTILKDFVRTVRPRKSNAFLTLSFAPGECAQVDWGQGHQTLSPQSRLRIYYSPASKQGVGKSGGRFLPNGFRQVSSEERNSNSSLLVFDYSLLPLTRKTILLQFIMDGQRLFVIHI